MGIFSISKRLDTLELDAVRELVAEHGTRFNNDIDFVTILSCSLSRHLVTLKLVNLCESSPQCANLPVVCPVSGVGTTPTELLEKVFPGLPVLQSLVLMRARRCRPVKI